VSEILYPEWRNNNQHVNYPFADTASLTNSDGRRINRDLFDDARLYPIGGEAGVFLSRIRVTGLEVTIFIGTVAVPELAFGTYQIASPPDELALVDSVGRPAGILVADSLRFGNVAGAYGIGDTDFEQEQTEFDSSVVIPLPQQGLQGILLDDGTLLTGDIYLVGTDGIVLRIDPDDGSIIIDTIGDPYALAKACDQAGAPLPGFCGLKTINNIKPDAKGDFKITEGANVAVDSIVRISSLGQGVVDISVVGNRGFPNA
jgi:hypothetical protein